MVDSSSLGATARRNRKTPAANSLLKMNRKKIPNARKKRAKKDGFLSVVSLPVIDDSLVFPMMGADKNPTGFHMTTQYSNQPLSTSLVVMMMGENDKIANVTQPIALCFNTQHDYEIKRRA